MAKIRYRVRNRSAYNRALVNRYRLEVWLSDLSARGRPPAQAVDVARGWYAQPTGRRERPLLYRDLALTFCLTLRALFDLPRRGGQGLLESVLPELEGPLSRVGGDGAYDRGEVWEPACAADDACLCVSARKQAAGRDGFWAVQRPLRRPAALPGVRESGNGRAAEGPSIEPHDLAGYAGPTPGQQLNPPGERGSPASPPDLGNKAIFHYFT